MIEYMSMFAHLYHLRPRDIDELELREFDVYADDIPDVLQMLRSGDGG